MHSLSTLKVWKVWGVNSQSGHDCVHRFPSRRSDVHVMFTVSCFLAVGATVGAYACLSLCVWPRPSEESPCLHPIPCTVLWMSLLSCSTTATSSHLRLRSSSPREHRPPPRPCLKRTRASSPPSLPANHRLRGQPRRGGASCCPPLLPASMARPTALSRSLRPTPVELSAWSTRRAALERPGWLSSFVTTLRRRTSVLYSGSNAWLSCFFPPVYSLSLCLFNGGEMWAFSLRVGWGHWWLLLASCSEASKTKHSPILKGKELVWHSQVMKVLTLCVEPCPGRSPWVRVEQRRRRTPSLY